MAKPVVSWEDFEKLDIRTGTIVTAEVFARAKKPAFKLTVDFGELGIKKTSAQIAHYNSGCLPGLQIVAIVNFPPKNIAGFLSECLVLGVYGGDGRVILLQPETKTENGRPIG